jgi:predicted enzyme related to lactoylglutathione lyase
MLPVIEGGHPAWNLYFACEDTDTTLAKINELGGGTVMGPMNPQRVALRDRARPEQRGLQRLSGGGDGD